MIATAQFDRIADAGVVRSRGSSRHVQTRFSAGFRKRAAKRLNSRVRSLQVTAGTCKDEDCKDKQ